MSDIDEAIAAFCEPRKVPKGDLAFRHFTRWLKMIPADQVPEVTEALRKRPLNQVDNITALVMLKEKFH